MQRASWTDERLDDLAEAMRSGFDRVDRDMRDLRSGMESLRQTVLRIGAGLMGGMTVGFLSVIVAIVARGA
ncbi:MAG: hypothetical protein ACM33U_10195 [Solirubrobacterales bacterium]|nr:hypothetical protein [Solirubrobacterales bacterium]